MEKSIYVDNLVLTVDTLEDYQQLKETSSAILADAKMELCAWERTGIVEESRVTSVLGLKLDKFSDTLFYDSIPMDLPIKVTKRITLSQIQRVFDPLGFMCPTLIVAKILLQKALMKDKRWDEEVTDDVREQFETWWTELSSIMEKFCLP